MELNDALLIKIPALDGLEIFTTPTQVKNELCLMYSRSAADSNAQIE